MYAIVIDVSINLVTHFIDVIQKATKKMSLPFERLITRMTIMAKYPCLTMSQQSRYMERS
jgi:hypothetical protein